MGDAGDVADVVCASCSECASGGVAELVAEVALDFEFGGVTFALVLVHAIHHPTANATIAAPTNMRKISIRELHEATGRWVRRASAAEVYVTERGRILAKIVPARPLAAKPFFASPKFTRAFLAQRKYLRGGPDSTDLISEDRDREVR